MPSGDAKGGHVGENVLAFAPAFVDGARVDLLQDRAA